MVAMNVWPTDASDGSVANEARWRKMARIWAQTGVVAGAGGELAPTLAYPNLTVKSGAAWVDGHYTELLGDQVLTVTANGIVVVRFDPAANLAELVYRDGITTPAQSPTGTYEMLIAAMSGSALTDKRLRVLPGGQIPKYDSAAALRLDTWSNVALVNLPAAGYVMATRNASGQWQATITIITGPYSTDSAGHVSYAPGQFGFTSFVAALANLSWSVSSPFPSFAQARVSSPTSVTVRHWNLSTTVSGATASQAGSQSFPSGLSLHMTGII